MSAEPAPSSLELVRREASEALERPLPYMSDGEVAAAYRTAKALADSGLFGDVKSAGQAFAKMLAGRDLGLTPFESMSALHVIEGKIEAGADLHATRVRSREGYDYRVVWLKVDGEWDGKPHPQSGRLVPPKVVGVPANEEDAADLRDVYGCAVEFTVDGERRGVARWTLEDSRVSGLLDRQGPRGGPGNHRKFPRSMYFARAMSQGVSLHVPEVMGGLRVYALGEVPRADGQDLGAGVGDDAAPAMDNLPTAVEAVLARARELGHAGLANRERWAIVAAQPAEQIGQAVARATRELNAYAARKRRGEPEPTEPEPPDAEVVPERCGVEFGAGVDGDPRPARCELAKGHDGPHTGPMVTPPAETTDPATGPVVTDAPAGGPETQNEPVCAPDPGEGTTGTDDPADGAQAPRSAAQAPESGEVVDGDATEVPDDRATRLREIAKLLLEDADAAEAEGKPEEAERLRIDAEHTKAEADAAADADQPTLGL